MDDTQQMACPYGPEFQIYWDMRYKLFSKFDEAMVDATGLYTMLPEAYALDMASRVSGSRSLDVCSGIGAMAVAMARNGQQVTAIEIDADRVAMAQHNAGIYGVAERIDFRNADITSTATLQSLPEDIDTLSLDPPWGDGPGGYQRRQLTYLEDLQLAGMDLRLLAENIACREVMMRLPPNFDIGIFRQARGEKIAYVTREGYLHWYYIRLPKQEFISIPDRSASHLGLEESREGIEAYFLRQ
jgi:trimethylguanosine synthase